MNDLIAPKIGTKSGFFFTKEIFAIINKITAKARWDRLAQERAHRGRSATAGDVFLWV